MSGAFGQYQEGNRRKALQINTFQIRGKVINMNPADILNIVTSQYGNVTEKYTTGIMLAGLVFALLNCFMGYKLRKIWGSILGLLIGAAGGGIAGYYFLHEAKYAVIAGIAGALVLGLLAWVFYKLGIFVLCAGLVYALANSFLSAPTNTGRIICIAIGIFAATMAIGYEEYVIIGITGICGGLGAIRILFSMTGKDGGAGTWMLGLILAFLGIAVQAAPLLRNREKKQGRGSSREPLFNRKKRKFSLPSLPGRKKKTKKKTVYKTTEKSRGNTSSGRAPSGSKRSGSGSQGSGSQSQTLRRQTEEPGEKTREIPDMAKLREQDYNTRPKPDHSSYSGVGTGIDLDDLSRELSQEIQKIYKEDE